MAAEVMKNSDRFQGIMPLADVFETENDYTLKLEVPGVEKDDVSIMLEDNDLEISAQVKQAAHDDTGLRAYREFNVPGYYRKFRLGSDINRDGIGAALENGVLTLTLNKAEEVKPKKIAINAH